MRPSSVEPKPVRGVAWSLCYAVPRRPIGGGTSRRDFSVRKRASALHIAILAIAVGSLGGCGIEPSLKNQLLLKQKEERASAVESQKSQIEATARAAGAVRLVPEDIYWDFRVEAQDYFASLEGARVLVEVYVDDVVRRPDGVVLSGKYPFTHPLLIWVRLHGVHEATIHEVKPRDSVVCIGVSTVTAPAGPYFEVRALREDEIEIDTSVIPLIVDINCAHAWRME